MPGFDFVILGLCNYLPCRIANILYKKIGIRIGKNSIIRRHFFSDNPNNIIIGENCLINHGVHVFPGNNADVQIEDYVKIGFDSKIICVSHEIGKSDCRAGINKYSSVKIEKGAWIGANVTILPGVTIGRGCVIGAGSVVTKNTERDSVYVGVPAKKIRSLVP